MPGDLVVMKADVFKGKRKTKDKWEDKPCEVVCQITTDVPLYKVMDQCGQSWILHHNRLLLVISETGVLLWLGVCKAWDRCTSPTPVKPTPKGSDSENTPWERSGLAITQCQTRLTSLGWISGKLQLLSLTSAGASTEDGWRLQVTCSGHATSTESCVFDRGRDITAHRCHQIMDQMTATIIHETESW